MTLPEFTVTFVVLDASH